MPILMCLTKRTEGSLWYVMAVKGNFTEGHQHGKGLYYVSIMFWKVGNCH